MAALTKQLLDDLLALPADERGRLIAELIASLDGAPDVDADAAWRDEIARRADRAVAGESDGEAWSAVRARIADDLGGE